MMDFSRILALYRAGNLQAARQHCQAILKHTPNHADALNLLGVMARAEGRAEEARVLAIRAMQARPQFFAYPFNLGLALLDLDHPKEAAVVFHKSVTLNPNFGDGWSALGSALRKLNRPQEALVALNNAARLLPNSAEAANMLGVALQERGEIIQAVEWYHKAVTINPRLAEAHANLGDAFLQLSQPEQAEKACRNALALKPDSAQAFNNLGNVLHDRGRMMEAIAAFRQALQLDNTFANAWNNLGNVLLYCAQPQEALHHFRQAIQIKQDFAIAHSTLLLAWHYHPEYEPRQVFADHVQWAERHERPLMTERQGFAHWDRNPERPLKVGFISPDLHRHPVGYFLEGVLANHDPRQTVIHCYSTHHQPDDFSRRMQATVEVWRDVHGKSDGEVAQIIRQDQVDILIELAGHTGKNSLLVMARKPAPIQMSWMGYVNTTGLSAMDYLITDRWETPTPSPYPLVEKPLFMPNGYVCYRPPDFAPEVAPLPALQNGYLTFGCANNWAKINQKVLALWAKLLHRVPTSRLSLKTKSLADGDLRQRALAFFRQQGIGEERIDLQGSSPAAELLAWYNTIDLALDPFPYSGGLTTLESLWMGVPVITLPGISFASRHSLSHLNAVGLPQFVADAPEGYLAIGEYWQEHIPRLAHLRQSLRGQMAQSPACDAPRFTRDWEQRLRQCWLHWLQSAPFT
ncbi:MAG: tetratricopeptide repeat protein [Magnetococcales bacterium]|nr:tetratricopeptide repeat protein [Magnetococcales bacterium]NGZ27257.1 tetratricopeptide repeat protein [Magnetococcales bacterium]